MPALTAGMWRQQLHTAVADAASAAGHRSSDVWPELCHVVLELRPGSTMAVTIATDINEAGNALYGHRQIPPHST